MENSNNKAEMSDLRIKAERLYKKNFSKKHPQLSESETLKLIHELEVHQIELKLQNEELILAKNAAQEATEKYVELYDYAPSGFFTLSHKGEILNLNFNGAKMLGKERAKLINSTICFFISEETKPIFETFLENIFSSKVKENCEVVITNNGNLPMHVVMTGIVSENKEQCFVTAMDTTELKKSETELIQAKEKAEESDRLKSAFLANMSHEIRTPMNGILGFTDLLKEPKLTGEEQEKYIQIIESSGQRLLSTVNDLIDFSKIEAGLIKMTVSNVNINELIEQLYIFFNGEAEKKGLQLLLDTTSLVENINLHSDKEKIYSILTNLIKNAIKYSKKGRIEFGYILKKDTEQGRSIEVQFFVKDTGHGISKEKLEVIFDRFIRGGGDEEIFTEGSGLGLSISKAYAEMLGGKIWVESEVGVGSQFYFTIPYDPSKEKISSTKEVGSEAKSETQLKDLKILITEDDEVADDLLSIIVKDISKEVIHTKSGVKAVDLCRDNSDIDLILMDINMPEMNGYEATKQIREFNKEVIIIAQTAYALAGDREKLMEAGCNDYITKPFNKNELLEKIEKCLVNK